MIKEKASKHFVRNLNEFSKDVVVNSPIQQFYNGETIFLTGGTGFLGKTLIEKLLRCCSGIERIYVLIRPKKGKDVEERVKELLNSSIFNGIKYQIPNFSKKIVGIPGDCTSVNLGLCNSDIDLLRNEVSIVFHVAATVRFDEQLKRAATTNIESTVNILELCKNMKNLKSCIHVSTAYSNCFVPYIEEKFYDYSIKYDGLLNLVKLLPEDTINKITPQIINPWPNTYTFTKALAEDFIRTNSKGLPVGIFRPGITANEPTCGWTDNFNGPTGVVASVATGVMRTMQCDSNLTPNIVPVDLTINALIASAWDVAEQTDRRDHNLLIYNFTSTAESPITWGSFSSIVQKSINKFPTKVALWYAGMELIKYKYLYFILGIFLHWIPAFLMDAVARGAGHKPKMQKLYKKINKLSEVVSYFCLNEWEFKNENVQQLWSLLDGRDKKLFHFTMKNFDWEGYLVNYVKGIRIYLLKDDMKTLEVSKIKWKKFYWLHQIVKTSLLSVIIYWFLWSISSSFTKIGLWNLKI